MVWPCRFVLQQVTLFSLITQWVKTGSLGFYIETFCGDKHREVTNCDHRF